MANEATIRANLTIRKSNLRYESKPLDFRATVTVGKGPSPGAILATRAGTLVDLSELALPGLCRIMNLDTVNDIVVGIGDGVEFYPLMDVKAGETYIIRLSKWLGRSINIGSAGTGSFDVTAYRLVVKAEYANCECLVEAFDS